MHPVNGNNGVGISGTGYARHIGRLNDLITNLQSLGLSSLGIEVPRIVVIGNQSAGKSSLVEAITKITVPRSKGTCTRCPMECRLKNTSKPWQCHISLRRGKNQGEVKFGPLITEKSTVEVMIKRAQLALLNPDVAYSDFVDLNIHTLVNGQPTFAQPKPLQFSSEVVVLDISGPDLVDLSFIDLPGIISHVAADEDPNNITLITNLAEEYISGDSLILLTLSMRDDLQNQRAATLARTADPQGERTIGVLTKPDAISALETQDWLEIIEGKKHPLKNGYYVTKQPSPEQLALNPSFKEARTQEEVYFATEEPWVSSSSHIKERIGIRKLTNALSLLLSKLIYRKLPKLREDAQAVREAALKELSALPTPLEKNPVLELMNILSSFSEKIRKYIEAADDDIEFKELIGYFRDASWAFKKDLYKTAPDFRPFVDAATEFGHYATPSQTMPGVTLITHFRNTVEEFDLFPSTLKDHPIESNLSPNTALSAHETMYLQNVKDHIKRHVSTGRELPFNVPYSAKSTLIKKNLSNWGTITEAFFDSVHRRSSQRLANAIEEHFSRFSDLKVDVRNIVDGEIKRLRKLTLERLEWFLKLENPPYTQSDLYFSSLIEKYLTKYKGAQRFQVGTARTGAAKMQLRTILLQLGELGIYNVTEDALESLNKWQEPRYENELKVMAEVSAYCLLAYKRAIDDVPRIIDHDFLMPLGSDMQMVLRRELDILGTEDGEGRARTYLKEDPSLFRKREELNKRIKVAEAVLKKLDEFRSADFDE
ncbi:P-loop containing nucleoside triphosphate hydrolase protein [Hysterangium stoloniferum]|nr:P-loop containing nucleoside triphosphate hydrolase protein [Hysterangium stoloniferum]